MNPPRKIRFIFATGMMGWSMLTNLIIVMGPYFYLPPAGDDISPLIPQIVWFGVINLLMIIVSAGRMVDAVFDPFIAHFSDAYKGRSGRRVPFLRFFALPAALFCALVFFPPDPTASILNAVWFAGMLIVFFISATGYVIPLNALIPEMTRTQEEKIDLSVWSQGGFVLGMITSALCNNYSAWILRAGITNDPTVALQITLSALCLIAGVLMLVPAFFISEKKYCLPAATATATLFVSIKRAFAIKNFRYYLVADLSFYIALSIISTGLVYFVTVLAKQPKETGGLLMATMVMGSLVFFPVVRSLSVRIGKKKVVLLAFAGMSIVFLLLSQMGNLPGSSRNWLFAVVGLAAFPVAALGITPTAILADIATEEGHGNEGLFFAVKYFFVKIGQTIGIGTFAFLTIYGIDPGNDWGLRLNGWVGTALCAVALIIFRKFKEN